MSGGRGWPTRAGASPPGRRSGSARACPLRRRLACALPLPRPGALPPPASLGQMLGAPMLLLHGSQEQKQRFLPPLARGEEYWCQFFSEPGSGSDLASAQTRAVRDGDVWHVDGQKVWTSGAQYADRGMLLARTNREVPKHQGLCFFIFDLDQPGVEVRPLHQMNGAHGFNEVFFTDARVDGDRLISEENGGWAVAVTVLMYERFMTSMPSATPVTSRGCWTGRRLRRAGRVRGTARAAAPARSSSRWPRRWPRRSDPVLRQRLAGLVGARRPLTVSWSAAGRASARAAAPSGAGSLTKLSRSALARSARETGMSVLGASGMLNSPELTPVRRHRVRRDPVPGPVQPQLLHRRRHRRDPARHRGRAGPGPAQGAAYRPRHPVQGPDRSEPSARPADE